MWLLDLIVKIRGSTESIVILDYALPLTFACEMKNVNLISFLVAGGYKSFSSSNEDEFALCCARAVVRDDVQIAMALCEHLGESLFSSKFVFCFCVRVVALCTAG